MSGLPKITSSQTDQHLVSLSPKTFVFGDKQIKYLSVRPAISFCLSLLRVFCQESVIFHHSMRGQNLPIQLVSVTYKLFMSVLPRSYKYIAYAEEMKIND